ncbi:iron ABC transporter substrate-binding protein [Anaerosporomusa subterranea]|uniref:Iron ABC transporter substrate-binding protein n=1 Tax=Anaerosporomusa subterranea TaxID=1794912 RepID=A0A154BN47_ANASB|nr:ABC transporter substrate-binding protein [Anaerosporomusa subterranea]KYZ75331.1 iron ABC transporter substrate-binding protein [Anaerosporomusa subterranea]
MMRKRRQIIAMGLVVLFLASLLAGCGGQAPATPQKPKEVTMYIGTVEQQALVIAKEFEKDTGIKVNFVRMSGGETLGRIRAEKQSPKASVWYGGPADTFIAAKQEGLLEAYKSKNAEKIPDNFKDKEGYWTGIYQGYLGFVLDGRFFEERKLPLPKTWADLLKPEFKGQVMVANPGSAGTAYTVLSTLVQSKGEKEALEYMAKLHKQIKQYTKAGEAPARSAALGEAAVGITFIHNGIRLIKEGYTNVKLSVPEDGTGYEVGAVGIIKGAPELEAAKIFVDWCLTKKAQELGQNNGSYQFLTNPEANPPAEALPFKGAKLINYDLKWSGDNRQRLVESWNKAIKE